MSHTASCCITRCLFHFAILRAAKPKLLPVVCLQTVTIGGAPCGLLVIGGSLQRIINSELIESPTSLSCTLPRGVGLAIPIVIQVAGLTSPVYNLLGYAQPEISRLNHDDCTVSSDLIHLENCPRAGGGLLTITGRNFGFSGAVSIVGSRVCANPVQPTSLEIICELPSGQFPGEAVFIIQSGGALSSGEAYISYVQCPPGTYNTASDFACIPCNDGFVSTSSGQYSCQSCVQGTFSNVDRHVCEDCPAGTFSLAAQTGCSACSAGEYSLPRAGSCIQCLPGSFSNRSSSSSCTDCAVGFYASQNGATVCSQCVRGMYASVSQTSTCLLCKEGYYSSSLGSSSCDACPTGFFQSAAGSGML